MTMTRRTCCGALLRAIAIALCITHAALAQVRFEEMAPVPGGIGFAGAFVGTSGDALLFAGGANFAEPVWDSDKVWHDRKGARLNAIRNRTLIADADIVVVRFGEKYKQWNAAFDAGCAVTLGKPIITLHPSEHDHAMKEIDAAASAVAREPRQVVAALAYVIRGDMPAKTKEAYAAE